MSGMLAAWRADHARFGRLLAQLWPQLDALHRGARPDYEGMLAIVADLREHGDKVHHPREDAAFERLARRRPELAARLARLQQEHRVIARGGETLLAQVEAVLDGAMLPREEIELSLATYLVYYGNHIAREEEDVLPMAAQALTAEDWAAVERAAPA
jgi:hemerythrin-like domain-containing protein